MSLTTEQILALSPDASSTKNGKALATPRKWAVLGHNEQVVWGECHGSGSKPYQTQIDLTEIAFKCSCPSRKFPCKHGLGLFLLLVEQPSTFTDHTPPGWVNEWLTARHQKRTKKTEPTEKVIDAAAQAKRAQQRYSKVAAGIQDLELWLRDLVRQGLAAAQAQPYSFWDQPAARLVDAQAPGIARQLREMASLPHSGTGWQERILAQLGRLYLLIEGFKRLETLPLDTQTDIRTAIGWSQSQEDLLGNQGVRDVWWVLGQRVEEQDRLRVQRTWLWGKNSGKAALILEFVHGSQHEDKSFVTGKSWDAELVFFPSVYPLRALVKTRSQIAEAVDGNPGYGAVKEAVAASASALARHPWLEEFPLALQAVMPMRYQDSWFLSDSTEYVLPIKPSFDKIQQLLALSGGHPIALFGEWDGEYFLPLSVKWTDGSFYLIK